MLTARRTKSELYIVVIVLALCAVVSTAAALLAQPTGNTVTKAEIVTKYTHGIATIGDGVTSSGMFNVNASAYGGDPVKVLNVAIEHASRVVFLRGDYTFSRPWITGRNNISIEADPGVNFTVTGTEAYGAFKFSGSRVKLKGPKFIIPTTTESQTIVEFNGSKTSEASELTFDFTSELLTASTSSPAVGIRFLDTLESRADSIHVYPAHAVVGMIQDGGSGNVWRDCVWSNNTYGNANTTVAGRHGWIGFQADNTLYCTLDGFRGFGVGVPGVEDTAASDGVRPYAVINWVGSEAAPVEDGHSIILNPRIEMCAGGQMILVEGVQAWMEINNPSIGIANGGNYKLGDAGIKITRHVATSKNSARISINGGSIHNLGRSQAVSLGAFLLLKGSLMVDTDGAGPDATNETVNVTTSNDTYTLQNGETWGVTPAAGDWVTWAGFSNSTNNGWHKIVSATSNTIVVADNLVDESGTGDETATGSTAWESCAVWLEYCSDVDIRGLRVNDQRHHWGVVIDPDTTRGIALDSVTFHKGSSTGAISPIRITTSTLLNKSTGYEDIEGVALSSLIFKGYGATLTPVSDGSVSTTLTTTAPTITTTNAAYFDSGLGDAASSGWTSKVTGTTMANLSSWMNLDK